MPRPAEKPIMPTIILIIFPPSIEIEILLLDALALFFSFWKENLILMLAMMKKAEMQIACNVF